MNMKYCNMERTEAHNDGFPVIIIGGSLQGKYTRKDIIEKFCIGKYTQDCSEVRARGIIIQRKELDRQPKIPGYVGPIWDNGILRYETPEVNEVLSL